jgi:DNA-binding response OmpR family regulator
MYPMKVLIVEDSKELCSAIEEGLNQRDFVVETALNGKTGREKALVNKYDAIVLDLNLPYLDGIDIARAIRNEDIQTPIIALTARDSLNDKLKGFDIGFDDYLTKPFDMKELIARIRALIRRSKANKDIVLKAEDIKLDPKKRKAWQDSEEIDLTKTEFNILELLLRNKGVAVKKTDIIELVWGSDPDILEPPVRSHIKTIRKKLKDDNFEIIQTVPGIGYTIADK